MAITVTPTPIFLPGVSTPPQTIQIAGGIAPYTAVSNNTSIATVSAVVPSLNLAHDSEFRRSLTSWSSPTTGPSWSKFGGVAWTIVADGPGGSNSVGVTGTGSAFGSAAIISPPITVVPTTVMDFAGFINSSVVTGGTLKMEIYSLTLGTNYQTFNPSGADSRKVAPIWNVPVGVTQIVIVFECTGCTVPGGTRLKFSQPSFVVGADPGFYTSDSTGAFTLYPVAPGTANITITDSTP